MLSRIKKLLPLFSQHDVDALFVSDSINVSYLLDKKTEDTFLLITPRKTYYITDSRYLLSAKNEVRDVLVVDHNGALAETIEGILKKACAGSLGFCGRHICFSAYRKLASQLGKGIRLVELHGFVEKVRARKDESEIKKMRAALKIQKQAYSYLKRIIRPGVSELAISQKLEGFIRDRNAAFSFPAIVASGANSCYPHAQVTDRKIRKNDLVLVDFGVEKYGYKSDLTRMFFLGRISKLIREVNDLVKESQRKAIEILSSGVKTSSVDYQARKYLQKNKLAKYFTHALGHGVGLEVHETPRLSSKDQTILEEGMVVTVEPAVYIPNEFGIRIEDMVLIKQEGCEVLSDDID